MRVLRKASRPSSTTKSSGRRSSKPAGRLSIGALSRATGIPVETIRTWETRYGYPVALRKPSGHRLYEIDAIPRLRRIAAALAAGHRAGEVVAASDEMLDALLAATAPNVAEMRAEPVIDLARLVDHVRLFEGAQLTRALMADWHRLGPITFLEQRVGPLLQVVGDSWGRGELRVRHEHFMSEQLESLLRALRAPLEEKATGPVVALATLSGELHGLGVQMAAVAMAHAGWRPVVLGTDVPARELIELCEELHPDAVAISVSVVTKGPSTDVQLRRLREQLSAKTALIVGGAGASAPAPGIDVTATISDLVAWARKHA
jgi:methanogenic corrinoid protein MtbC1